MFNLRVASVQFEHAAGDKAHNLSIIESFVSEAAERRVELIAFPEMCITGYWHVRRLSRDEIEDLSEPVPGGPSTKKLLDLARNHRMMIGAGLIERDADGSFYNTWGVAMPDGSAGKHRKLHAFISEYISSGNSYTVFDAPQGARVGILICYDNNIIENARITALMGADVLLAPHQTGGCNSRSPRAMGLIDPELWFRRHEDPTPIENECRGPKGRGWLLRWLPSRAHDNGMFLVFSNGIGFDDGEVRTGNAMILDPYGEIIVESTKIGNDMIVADLDGRELELCTGRRWMTVRRPDLYSRLVEKTGRELPTRRVRFGQ